MNDDSRKKPNDTLDKWASLSDVDQLGRSANDDDRGQELVSKQIAELNGQIQEKDDALSEQKFLFVLVAVIVVNMHVFMSFSNWAAPVVIGLFELVGLVVYAERCRVNAIAPLLDRLTGMVKRSRS